MRNYILLIIAIFLSFCISAQHVISGLVIESENNQPISGVAISVKNSNLGTATDLSGRFELSIPDDATFLVFSCLGMLTKEVEIGGQKELTVVLEKDVFSLDGVVVTAIGITREKKALGYSVQELSPEEINVTKTDNLVNVLNGKVAGVQVTSSAGSPGASSYITIRGATSFYGDNQPLFVLDGVPISNESAYLSYGGVTVSNRVIDLNPDDIESVAVLKGGAATALYGMKAANGAIVIESKKGMPTPGNKVNVTFHTSVSISRVSQLPELQSRYGQGYDGSWISGSSTSWGPRLDTCSYSKDPTLWTHPGFDVDGAIVSKNEASATGEAVRSYDQYEYFQTAVSTLNTINISGGNEKSTFATAVSYTNTEGTIPGDKFTRFTAKIAGDTHISEQFSVFGSANYIRSVGYFNQKGSNASGVMVGLLRTPTSFNNAAGYEFPDGTQRNYRHGSGYDNPYWTVNKNIFYDEVDRLIGRLGFKWNITSWMDLNYTLGLDFYSWDWKNHFAIGSAEYPDGRVYVDFYSRRNVNSDLLLNIHHQFNKNWKFNLTLGNNLFEGWAEGLNSTGNGLELPGFYHLSNAVDINTNSNTLKLRRAAFFGSMEVDYRDMVYLTLTGRNEWATTLPAEDNSFFYPSASISWIFTELDALKSSKALPFGKLRFSYAMVASDPLVYQTSIYYSQAEVSGTWTYGLRFPLLGYTGFKTSTYMGNDQLRPEQTSTWEIGTDLRFIDNRISLDFTWYYSYSNDLLLWVPVAPSTGFRTMYTNAGEMSSQGFEVVLGAQAIKSKNWSWDILLNFTRIRNVVEKLVPDVEYVNLGGFEPIIGAKVGYDYQSFWGWDWLRDESGNLIINDDPENPAYGFPMGNYDTVINFGKFNPDWTLGWTNSIRWKDLTFSFLIDLRIGGMMWNGTKATLYYFGSHADQVTREPDDIYIFPGVKQSDGSPNDIEVVKDINWYNKGEGSSFTGPGGPYVENTDWIRLREIALSYRFNRKILGDGFVKQLELYISGKNLWLSTEYTGIDPETSLVGAFNAQGADFYNNPGVRQLTFGLRAGF